MAEIEGGAVYGSFGVAIVGERKRREEKRELLCYDPSSHSLLRSYQCLFILRTCILDFSIMGIAFIKLLSLIYPLLHATSYSNTMCVDIRSPALSTSQTSRLLLNLVPYETLKLPCHLFP
jgi:hypothetical protein